MPGSSDMTGIIFVENFTVFYIPDIGKASKSVYPISSNVAIIPEVVINGVPDWIYEGNLHLHIYYFIT